MMEEIAKVVACHKGWIQVEVELKSACNHCESQESCGTSAVAKAFGNKTQVFSLPHEQSYPVGDMLRIGLPESVILKAAALVYMSPLLGLFLGGVSSSIILSLLDINNELMVMLMAFIGGATAWYFARQQAKKLETDTVPVVVAHLGHEISIKRMSN